MIPQIRLSVYLYEEFQVLYAPETNRASEGLEIDIEYSSNARHRMNTMAFVLSQHHELGTASVWSYSVRSTCVCHSLSFPLPSLELLIQVTLQLLELVLERPSAAPALQISLEIACSPRVPSRVVRCERKVLDGHEKGRRKAVVMLPMLHALTHPVHAQHVDMKMLHGRMGVHAGDDARLPVPAGREVGLCGQLVRIQGGVAAGLGGGESPKASPQLRRGEPAHPCRLGLDHGEEGGVVAVQRLEGVQQLLGRVPRQQQEVELRFREQVVDDDEVVVVGDDARRGEGRWRVRVGFQSAPAGGGVQIPATWGFRGVGAGGAVLRLLRRHEFGDCVGAGRVRRGSCPAGDKRIDI